MWVNNNGFIGEKFTDKATGNSIFLPAAGYINLLGGSTFNVGYYGGYWSSTVSDASDAYALCFGGGATGCWWGSGDRSTGFSVRPVAE